MSHIVRFCIKGLAGRKEDVEFKLDRHINIFFGENGAGKSSLLKILYSAMTQNPGIIADTPFLEAEVEVFSISRDRSFVYKIVKPIPKPGPPLTANSLSNILPLAGLSNIGQVSIKYNIQEFSQDGAPKREDLPVEEFRWKMISDPDEDIDRFQRVAWFCHYLGINRQLDGLSYNVITGRAKEQTIEQQFAHAIQSKWAAVNTEAVQRVSDAQQKGLANILGDVLSRKIEKPFSKLKNIDMSILYKRVQTFITRTGTNIVLPVLEEFKTQYNKDMHFRHIVNDIEHTEENIEKANLPLIKIAGLISSLFKKNKNIIFNSKTIEVVDLEGNLIGIENLSSGERQLMRLLLESILAEQSSLLIDEPELSMHIDWQKNLVEMIKSLSPDCQMILATHSPEIMGDVPSKYIIKL